MTKSKELMVTDFLKKYDLDENKLAEFSRYINLYPKTKNLEHKAKLAETYHAMASNLIKNGIENGKISKKEKATGGNFLKELDELSSPNDVFKNINIGILAEIIISKIDRKFLPKQTISEIQDRINNENSNLTPEIATKFTNFYQDNFLTLGKDSNFYKFMMEQDSNKLAKIFSEAGYGNLGTMHNINIEDVCSNSPKELIEKIKDVTKKIMERQNSSHLLLLMKDKWNDVLEVVGKFFNLIKDKEIPGFDESLGDLNKCRNQQQQKTVEIIGQKLEGTFQKQYKERSKEQKQKTISN